jgi:hypothetical protein
MWTPLHIGNGVKAIIERQLKQLWKVALILSELGVLARYPGITTAVMGVIQRIFRVDTTVNEGLDEHVIVIDPDIVEVPLHEIAGLHPEGPVNTLMIANRNVRGLGPKLIHRS